MQTANDEVIHVIITDDHVLYRAGVIASLAFTNRIKVIGEAENGSCLLSLLQNSKPDVILLDVQMPVMDGITTLPELKKFYPHIKVIVLSMVDDQSMITKLMELGANSYLAKTSDPEIIYEAIQTCHEHEYFYNALTARSLHHISQKKHLN